MPKKIVDIENLKAFREKLDDKYVIEGEYSPTTSVGLADAADSLTPYGPNSGANDTTPFVFQTSGGNSDIGAKSYLRALRGNTIVFNQLFINGDMSSSSYWYGANGTVSIDTTNKELTYTVTTQGQNYWDNYVGSAYNSSVPVITGHKYLIRYDLMLLQGSDEIKTVFQKYTSNITNKVSTNEVALNKWVQCGSIETYENPQSQAVAFNIHFGEVPQVGDSFKIRNLIYVDLTQMFGAGNEPETIVEFNRLFTKGGYSYNAGTLLSCQTNGYKTVGFNAFDGQLEQGGINGSTGVPYAIATQVRSKNFIKVIGGQTYTNEKPDSTVVLTEKFIYEYDGDYNFIKNTYQSATTNTGVQLDDNTHYIKVSYVSASNLAPNNLSNCCVHLTWDGSKTGYEEYESNTYTMPNIELRSNPATGTFDTLEPNGKLTRKIGYRAYQSGDENDSSLTTDMTNTVYDLQTPIETQDDDYKYQELTPIDDFGTQEFLSEQSIQVPQGNDFFYPVDYKAFIDSLGEREDIDWDASKLVSQTELQQAISGSGGGSGGANEDLISDAYDNTKTYAIGDLVIYNDTLYRCTTAVTSAEDFDSNKWTATDVASELANRVTLDTNQTITGEKTFNTTVILTNNNKLRFGPTSSTAKYFETSGANVIFGKSLNTPIFTFSNTSFYPNTNDNYDLGLANYHFKDLYLSGSIKDGTNEFNANNVFNVINASDITGNTLTQAQYDLITNGKPTLIKGVITISNTSFINVIILSTNNEGTSQSETTAIFIGYISNNTCTIRTLIISASTLQLSLRTNVPINISQGGSLSIYGKLIPAYPSSTGTFTLKCVNGTLTWVAD